MPFDWTDYTRLADELSKRGDEASLRTAISRLYYSVFHEARDYLLAEGIALSTAESSHKVVWNAYRDMGKSCKSVGENGHRLHDYRRKADYERQVLDIRQLVGATFIIARNIQTYLEQCKRSRLG